LDSKTQPITSSCPSFDRFRLRRILACWNTRIFSATVVLVRAWISGIVRSQRTFPPYQRPAAARHMVRRKTPELDQVERFLQGPCRPWPRRKHREQALLAPGSGRHTVIAVVTNLCGFSRNQSNSGLRNQVRAALLVVAAVVLFGAVVMLR